MCTTRYVLLRLHHAVSVAAALRLHGNHELPTMPVNADVNLVNFYLTDPRHGGAQVVLQRERGDAEEYIDQPVVANLREQGLFVAQRVGHDDLGRCIRHLDRYQFLARNDAIQTHLFDAIASVPRSFDNPFVASSCFCFDRVRQFDAIANRINHVSQIFRQDDF